MLDSLLRDQPTDDDSAQGAVDKSVVNWLMQVISAKDPIGLGINDASQEQAPPVAPGPKIVPSREEPRLNATNVSQVNVTAEDLCGPVMHSEPAVETRPVQQTQPYEASKPVSEPMKRKADRESPEPETPETETESGPGVFKRMFGLKLIGGSKPSQKIVPDDPKPLTSALLREGASFGPPHTQTSSSIADSLRPSSTNTQDAAAGGLDLLDLVRDPDYYEEKLRERQAAALKEVDFIPVQAAAPVAPAPERSAPAAKAAPEPELLHVVHEVEAVFEPPAPAAPAVSDPFAAIDVQPHAKAVQAELTADGPPAPAIPDPFAGIDFASTAQAVSQPVVPAIPDPFAGIEFPAPPPVEAAAPQPAVPAIPDPFAGIHPPVRTSAVEVLPEPVSTSAEQEVAPSQDFPEPQADVATPEPEVVPPQSAPEPEPQAIQVESHEPAAPAAPDPSYEVDPSIEPAAQLEPQQLVAVESHPEARAIDPQITESVHAQELDPEQTEAPSESQPVALMHHHEAVEASAIHESQLEIVDATASAEPQLEAPAMTDPTVAAVPEPEPELVPEVASDHLPQVLEFPPAAHLHIEEPPAFEAPQVELQPEQAPNLTFVPDAEPQLMTSPQVGEEPAPAVAEEAPPAIDDAISPEFAHAEHFPHAEAGSASEVEQPLVHEQAAFEHTIAESSEFSNALFADTEVQTSQEASPIASEVFAESVPFPSEADPLPVDEPSIEVDHPAEDAPSTAAPAEQHETKSAEDVIPWTIAVAQRNPTDKTFSAQDYYQQMQKKSPAKTAPEAPSVKPGEARPEDLTAAIKTIMQLGSALPVAGRANPGPESNPEAETPAPDPHEVRQEVSGLRLLQYEIKTTVQDHSMHLRRLEEQLSQMRESVEMDSADSASMKDDVKSTAKLIRVMGIGLGVMLMVLILLIGMMLVHAK